MVQIFVWTTNLNFRSLNIRTTQHSDVEHIDIIVQGKFRMMLFNTKYIKHFHHTKITRYTVFMSITNCPSSPCLDRAMMRALSMSTVLLRWRQAAALSVSMKLMKHTLEGTLRAANSLHGERGDKMEGDGLCRVCEWKMDAIVQTKLTIKGSDTVSWPHKSYCMYVHQTERHNTNNSGCYTDL